MRLGERILSAVSMPATNGNLHSAEDEWKPGSELEILERVFPSFSTRIRGKRVLDFGCGYGYQAVAMARAGAAFVAGLDSNENTLRRAQEHAARTNVGGNVEFFSSISDAMRNSFDAVISQNSFEHFPQPVQALNAMKDLIKPDGEIFISFGPPWFAPYGSHMQFFTRVPWVNLLFSEETVMSVRSRFRTDGARRYEDVESGLNRMTVSRFESIVRECGMEIAYTKYECVKGITALRMAPLLRELFINHISCILKKR